jgi:hypothetical protein
MREAKVGGRWLHRWINHHGNKRNPSLDSLQPEFTMQDAGFAEPPAHTFRELLGKPCLAQGLSCIGTVLACEGQPGVFGA